jgi:cobalt-zinc-cadmium efflux system outer membrane protein
MSPFRVAGICALTVNLLAGAQALHAQSTPPRDGDRLSRRLFTPPSPTGRGSDIERLPVPRDQVGDQVDSRRFGDYQLLAEDLVVDVLARHPSIDAAAAAWQAAAARYPQAVSLDDPMFDFMMAPGTIGSRDVDFAYMLQGRQKVPWPGKRPLRGAVAAQESRAAYQEIPDARLRLALTARLAFHEYAAASQLLALNFANRRAVEEFRDDALTRYEANLVSRQDVLLADLELAELDRSQIELNRAEHVAAARINTLLLRHPGAPLPRPAPLQSVVALPDIDLLQQLAFEQRPDLAAADSQLRAERAGISLAEREFKPDVELVGRYDAFWLPQQALTGQVGVTVNVPLAQARRRAAVREAQAKSTQRHAELEALVVQAQYEVQEAYERLYEMGQTMLLYDRRIVPLAQDSVQSAQAEYLTGKLDFLRLIQAQRELIAVRERRVQALADYHARRADLERVIGGPLPFQSQPDDR